MERLQKVMAHAGVDSRRKCEDLIVQGRVKVNGETVTELGTKVDARDLIEVDGVPIYKEEPRYILLYKPKNVISAVSDPHDRPVVTDLVEGISERIYPIGRLDFDTTGLILLTNNGDFAHLLMHPRHEIPKTYIATVNGIPTPEALKKLSSGVMLDGKKTSKARASLLSKNTQKNTSVVQLTIHEGWNHQVKRMFEAVGHVVYRLKRERFGFLDLGHLNPGEWRELTRFEVDKLTKMAESIKN
ncbi:pseudouridine synthase [Dolosicoccus paucivorans]|uniref:Pseudouridine synthase n=1 Tax=Dolosicoccus paucivorans TaxID=84521 RepID=A0A2N6SPF0_9LACT|nr:pseudouridine synthase [Dolosicoccus paucivorans]PMB85114.1 pseudouridine synthase [Dolosicoccus paucivorans]PMC58916.1 pseudouridine synthase [Dolosicoccus paucivorans]